MTYSTVLDQSFPSLVPWFLLARPRSREGGKKLSQNDSLPTIWCLSNVFFIYVSRRTLFSYIDRWPGYYQQPFPPDELHNGLNVLFVLKLCGALRSNRKPWDFQVFFLKNNRVARSSTRSCSVQRCKDRDPCAVLLYLLLVLPRAAHSN